MNMCNLASIHCTSNKNNNQHARLPSTTVWSFLRLVGILFPTPWKLNGPKRVYSRSFLWRKTNREKSVDFVHNYIVIHIHGIQQCRATKNVSARTQIMYALHYTFISTILASKKGIESMQFNQIVFAKLVEAEFRFLSLYRFCCCQCTNRKSKKRHRIFHSLDHWPFAKITTK